MRILAIDGTGPIAVAACVARPGGEPVILASIERAIARDADLLPAGVAACLAAAGWSARSWDVLACSIGPGSFTGIRVAVALARGLAMAAGRPVLAVTRFEAIAAHARGAGITAPLQVVIDGGRGNWYVQDMGSAGTISQPPAIMPAIPQESGAGMMVGSGPGVTEVESDATDVARVAAIRLAGGEQPVQGMDLVPLYLRGADARADAGRSLLQAAGYAPWR